MTSTENVKRLNAIVNARNPIKNDVLKKIQMAMAAVNEAAEYYQAADSDGNLIDACKTNATAGVTLAITDLSVILKQEGF